MIEQLISLDQQFFIWLNGFHTDWLDPVMLWITSSKTWIPFYILLVILLARKFKWETVFTVLMVAILITICDQFTSSFMKPFFARLRPCHEPALEGLVHLVKHCGGQYGYASSHAANTFGLATFLWIAFSKRGFKWFAYLFVWAAVVSYSRIYVGVHYPADILTGGLLGVIFGFLIAKLYLRLEKKYFHKKNNKDTLATY